MFKNQMKLFYTKNAGLHSVGTEFLYFGNLKRSAQIKCYINQYFQLKIDNLEKTASSVGRVLFVIMLARVSSNISKLSLHHYRFLFWESNIPK